MDFPWNASSAALTKVQTATLYPAVLDKLLPIRATLVTARCVLIRSAAS
jgi:hypothetical protein